MFSPSVVSDSATPQTVAREAPLSMGFFRQEYWSGLPFPSPRGLPDREIKPASPFSPALQVDSLPIKSSVILDVMKVSCFLHYLNAVDISLVGGRGEKGKKKREQKERKESKQKMKQDHSHCPR